MRAGSSGVLFAEQPGQSRLWEETSGQGKYWRRRSETVSNLANSSCGRHTGKSRRMTVPPGWTGRKSRTSSRVWSTICTRSGIACPLRTWFPPPVLGVEIPKEHGAGTRLLGVPTVADRIAQTVAALTLEPHLESIVHDSSYGYRPKRSQEMALEECRQQCWEK